MASYNYDESGNMALYFIITVLSIILVPFTLSFLLSSSSSKYSCRRVSEIQEIRRADNLVLCRTCYYVGL